MYMKDFAYAGKRLSDFGCIVAYLNTSLPNNISLENKIKFETLKNTSTHINRVVKVDYETPSPVTFDICKNPCGNTMVFTDIEISYLMRWLNKKSYEIFRPIYDNGFYPDIYFKGSFNVSAIYIAGDVVGFTLSFTPNSPFAYDNEKDMVININAANESFAFYNNSDEYGYMYPVKFVITCKDTGNFTMTNDIDDNIVKIDNCENGEIVTLDCYNKIITSNLSHPYLYNDFNYNYPRFVSNENTNRNVFTVSLPCSITVTYSYPRKAGIIV